MTAWPGEMPPRCRQWWLAGVLAGMTYGVMLLQAALDLPAGTPLAGRLPYQPLLKCAMALLLARAAWFHPVRHERRWLVTALLCSAVGDLLLAMPGLRISFTGGLGAFLLAHLAYLAVLVPLAGDLRAPRLLACGVVLGIAGTLLGRFWPNLGELTVPVSLYIGTLVAMVCAALLARLPTPWVAIGAVCFAASDALIGVERFLSPFDRFPLGIWWLYALAQMALVAGILAGRRP